MLTLLHTTLCLEALKVVAKKLIYQLQRLPLLVLIKVIKMSLLFLCLWLPMLLLTRLLLLLLPLQMRLQLM
jgi:hypothetical protein